MKRARIVLIGTSIGALMILAAHLRDDEASRETARAGHATAKPPGRDDRTPRAGAMMPSVHPAETPMLAATDAAARERQLEILAEAVPAGELRPTLDALSPAELQGGFGATLFRRWARSDPLAAARWAMACADGPARLALVQAAAVFWTQQDLPAARAWWSSLPASADGRRFLSAMAFEALNVDPVQALALTIDLRADERRDELMRHALAAWAAAKPLAAAAWVRELPAGDERDRLIAESIPALAEKNAAVAAQLALDCLPPGIQRDDAIVSVVQAWARKAPKTAAAWVEQFPAGPLQSAAITQLVGEWKANNATQCAMWLAQLEPANARLYELAMTAFVSQFAPSDPIWVPRKG